MTIPAITNIVTTMDLGCALDLVKMSTTLPDARYKPEKFNAVFLTIKDPSSTFTIFQNGKANSAGNKTVENAKLAADHLVLLLNERLEIQAQVKEFRVTNYCGTIDVGFRINLGDLNQAKHEFSQYHPEIFCGLTYRLQNPKVTATVFATGKVNFAGAKTIEQIRHAADQISLILAPFRIL